MERYLSHFNSADNKDELINWLSIALDRGNDNFRSQVIRLVFKADNGNRYKLFQVYPDEVSVAMAWKSGMIKESEVSNG